MLVRGRTAADPAELIRAQPASDVIAATLNFLDLCPTERAEANIDLLLQRPELELLLQV